MTRFAGLFSAGRERSSPVFAEVDQRLLRSHAAAVTELDELGHVDAAAAGLGTGDPPLALADLVCKLALRQAGRLSQESRDPETGAHIERVQHYCKTLAEQLANDSEYKTACDPELIRLIYTTSPLHDIGKVGILDDKVLKPGRSSDREF